MAGSANLNVMMKTARKAGRALLKDFTEVEQLQVSTKGPGDFVMPFAGRADLPDTLQDLARLLPASAGVRRFGAASLDLAYVATGRYEGFWERKLQVSGWGGW